MGKFGIWDQIGHLTDEAGNKWKIVYISRAGRDGRTGPVSFTPDLILVGEDGLPSSDLKLKGQPDEESNKEPKTETGGSL